MDFRERGWSWCVYLRLRKILVCVSSMFYGEMILLLKMKIKGFRITVFE